MTDLARLLDAAAFAADRHRTQRRKDPDATPYINHPLAVARLLADEGGVDDVEILIAALLHDTIEDTATSADEIAARFGARVAGIVLELTDDGSLPKARRKALQVERAPHASAAATLVKLADKTCNLRDIAVSAPVGWSVERAAAYFDWAERVAAALPAIDTPLRRCFAEALARRPRVSG